MLGSRWPHKPPVGYRIDFENPLAQGLLAFWAMNEGCGVPCDAAGQTVPVSNSAVWTASPSGRVLQFNGTSSYVDIGLCPAINTTGPVTVAAFAAPAASTAQIFVDTRNSAFNAGWLFAVDFNAGNEIDFENAALATTVYSSASAVDGNRHLFAVSMGSTATGGVAFYRDGVPFGTSTLASFPTAATGSAHAIGAREDGAAKWFDGPIGWVGVWGRALAPAEHAALATNAWQIFQPRRSQAYFGLIAAQPLAYAVTGPASGTTGSASTNFTITPNLTIASDTISFSDGGAGGTFTPTSRTFTTSAVPLTFTYTPATTGNITLTLTSGHSYPIAGSPLSYTALPIAVNFTLTGPASGTLGVTSTNFTVTPASSATDTVTFSDNDAGGTFTPTSLTFAGSSLAQRFTYTPTTVGPKALTLTSADGATITGSPFTYTPLPATTGSIRFTNECYYATTSNSLLNDASAATVAFRVQFNSLSGCGASPGIPVINKGTNGGLFALAANPNYLGTFLTEMFGASSTSFLVRVPITTGIPYHVVIVWTNGAQTVYLDSYPIGTASVAEPTGSYTGALLLGAQAVAPVDFQLSDVAIWSGFAADAQDVANLWVGTYNPLTLVSNATTDLTPATAWFPLNGTTSAHPAINDLALQDWAGNGYSFASLTGTNTNATYAAAIGYAPLLETAAYVSKSGKVAFFFPVVTVPAPNGYNVPQIVTSVPDNPTITWNGQTIEADGPAWSNATNSTTPAPIYAYPWVAYRLQCGSVLSVAIVNGGSGFTGAPSVSAPSGLVLGTPVLGLGLSDLTMTSAGSGYLSTGTIGAVYSLVPATPPICPAPTYSNSSGGGITALTLKTTNFASYGDWTGVAGATVGATVTIDLVSANGSGAVYTATLIAYVKLIPVTSSVATFTELPTIAITGGGGSGATAVAVMSGAVAGDVLTYTAPAGWLVASQSIEGTLYPIGGALSSPPPGSSTAASIVNFAGTTEGQAGLLAGFPTARTMGLGLNTGSQSTYSAAVNSMFADYTKRTDPWDAKWANSGGAVTLLLDGTPYIWTNGAEPITNTFCLGSMPNPIDYKGSPQRAGVWTLSYTDNGPANNANASTVALFVNASSAVATCTIVEGYPQTVDGVTTSQWTVAYAENTTSWDWELSIKVTQTNGTSGTWWLENPVILPPNNTNTSPLAVDANVITWLTTPRNQTPACLRFMDVNANSGGESNYVDEDDLMAPTSFAWGNPVIQFGISDGAPPGTIENPNHDGTYNQSGKVVISGYRCYNTDPGDGNFAYSSPNLYISQWGFTATDPMLGPYFTFSDANVSDNGTYMIGPGNNPQDYAAVEITCDRSHGLKTGQFIDLYVSGTVTIALAGISPTVNLGGGYFIFVTGSATFAIAVYLSQGQPGTTIQRVTPDTPTTLTGAYLTIQNPEGPLTPFEFSAAMGSQLNSDIWISVPPMASLACSTAIAQRVAANLTAGLKVYLEWANETWNSQFSALGKCQFLGGLCGQFPVGTPVGNYYETTGASIGATAFYVFWSSAHHDAWDAVFTGLGRPNSIVRVFGSWQAQPSQSVTIAAVATQHGVPADALSIAAYGYMENDTPLVNACLPAGAAGTPGNWPADAMIDLMKHSFFYNPQVWSWYAQHAAAAAAWGQPIIATTLSASGSGGSLPAGYYYAYYTFVNSASQETTVGLSQSATPVAITAGQVLTVTLATPPAGCTINLYLTPVNSPPGTQVLYKSGATNPYTCSAAFPGTVTFPPATNGVTPTHAPPRMVGYEFSPSQLTPGGPFHNPISRDIFYHPAYYDLHTVLFSSLQVGHPGVAGSGLTMANFFELVNQWTTDGDIFSLAITTAQSYGLGTDNLFATAQGGFPADNQSHDLGNQVPALQAARDWWDALAPIGYTLTGPTSAVARAPSSPFTVTPAGAVTDSVTLSDNAAGGTFTPASPLTFADSSTAQTFTYTPVAAGSVTLTLTSQDGGAIAGSPWTLSVAAIGYALSGPSSGLEGVASLPFTLTPTTTITSDTVTFSDGSQGGVFTPSQLVFTDSSVPQTFTYTAASAGLIALTLTSSVGGTITGNPVSYYVTFIAYVSPQAASILY